MRTAKTTRFGEIEVLPQDVVTLPKGLIGFPELKDYVILDSPDPKHDGIKWLQSLDDGQIAFLVTAPGRIKPDYTLEATEAEVADLGLTSEEDATLAVILTVGTRGVTANLKGPLVFSKTTRRGVQIIHPDRDYSTRYQVAAQ